MSRKASDGIVQARTVLDCVLRLQRQGTLHAMQQLEETEPDLANYLFETLSAFHHSLSKLPIPPPRVRRIYRQVEVMTFACIEALRQSHYELWQQQMDGPVRPSDQDHDSNADRPHPPA